MNSERNNKSPLEKHTEQEQFFDRFNKHITVLTIYLSAEVVAYAYQSRLLAATRSVIEFADRHIVH